MQLGENHEFNSFSTSLILYRKYVWRKRGEKKILCRKSDKCGLIFLFLPEVVMVLWEEAMVTEWPSADTDTGCIAGCV